MSKAFTKEDIDPPERSGRVRSASGLPPGAANYITQGGAARLRRELAQLRGADGNHAEKIADLMRILGSVTVVEPPEDPGRDVGFGARVTLCDPMNREKIYRILGVDELDLDPEAVSWVSPIGRTLLASKLGDRVSLAETGPAKVVKVEYPADSESKI